MITVKIDVDKIDKTRFFIGKKGRYLHLVLLESPNNKYGDDYLVKQESTPEERKARTQLPIIGNAKIWENRNGPRASKPTVEDW